MNQIEKVNKSKQDLKKKLIQKVNRMKPQTTSEAKSYFAYWWKKLGGK